MYIRKCMRVRVCDYHFYIAIHFIISYVYTVYVYVYVIYIKTMQAVTISTSQTSKLQEYC